jgi:hypothetical protein
MKNVENNTGVPDSSEKPDDKPKGTQSQSQQQEKQQPGQQPDIDKSADEIQPNAIINKERGVTNKQSETFEQDIQTARESDPERSGGKLPLGEDPNEIAELENLDNNEEETEQGSNKPF